MPTKQSKPTAHVEILPAKRGQQHIIANLLQLYAHDFSSFYDIEPGPDGRFEYSTLPLYFTEPHRHPFLIRANGELAGFALITKGSQISGNHTSWDVAEFFVLRGHRGRGIGLNAALALWRQFPGPWEVRVMQANVAALPFWTEAVTRFTGKPSDPRPLEREGQSWLLFSFMSPA